LKSEKNKTSKWQILKNQESKRKYERRQELDKNQEEETAGQRQRKTKENFCSFLG
jgi:hypothetical protein